MTHMQQLAMLGPVVVALRNRGIKARHECPGYVQIEGRDFVYAPSADHWLLIHTSNRQGPLDAFNGGRVQRSRADR